MKSKSGILGEEHIVRLLANRGYQIVARNYHSRFGEIDIIARKEPYLVFVEVKTRSPESLVSPFEAITPAKRRKILATAGVFLQAHPSRLQPRFDAAAVTVRDGEVLGEEYMENAFIAGGWA